MCSIKLSCKITYFLLSGLVLENAGLKPISYEVTDLLLTAMQTVTAAVVVQ